VIVAQVGISGSTVLGDFVQVGGQAAMAGHLHIGDGAQIGPQAGVISDAPAGAVLLGSPRPTPASILPAGGYSQTPWSINQNRIPVHRWSYEGIWVTG